MDIGRDLPADAVTPALARHLSGDAVGLYIEITRASRIRGTTRPRSGDVHPDAVGHV